MIISAAHIQQIRLWTTRKQASYAGRDIDEGDQMLAARADQLGTETAFTVLARAAELAAQGRDIINLGIGQPDFPTPDHIVEAGMRALKDGAHGYTPSSGGRPLA